MHIRGRTNIDIFRITSPFFGDIGFRCGAVDTRYYNSRAHYAACYCAAYFIDKGLEGKGYAVVAFSKFPVARIQSYLQET